MGTKSVFHVSIRFYQELNDFLPPSNRKRDIDAVFVDRRSVKDLIESCGIPHVEVDLILVNGESTTFEYIVTDGDRVSVYPVFERLDISSVTRLRPRPLRRPRVVLDVHLKTLAGKLRLLGFDCIYDPALDDPDLARVSSEQNRILLTRDRQLLMRRIVSRGLYVRATDPGEQVPEIVARLDLRSLFQPFARCAECNGIIQAVPETRLDAVLAETPVPDGVRRWCREYSRCEGCGKMYWKGSHYSRILEYIESLLL